MEQYIPIFSMIHKAALWSLLLYGFLFSGSANVRWLMCFLLAVFLAGKAISGIVATTGAPGWTYHVSLILLLYFAYRYVLLYRPFYAHKLSRYTRKLPVLRHLLPDTTPRIYSAELVIRSMCLGTIVMHSVVLLHWIANALAWTYDGGLFERVGLWQNVLYDLSLMMYCILAIGYVLLLVCLLVSRCRERVVFYRA